MKNEYGKKDYQKDYQKGYQASQNKTGNPKQPNTPTQGGFSTPGGGQGLGKQPQKQPQQPYNKNQTQTNNTWGTGSIGGDKNKDRR